MSRQPRKRKSGAMSGKFGNTYVERTAARFWGKVDRRGPNDCWMWLGTKAIPGRAGTRYGTFGVSENGKAFNYRAHRMAYMLACGEIPDGMLVMHTCDTTLCVNPSHLKLGTNADNMADRNKKRRVAFGERHGNSRLTEDDARYIMDSDESPRALGQKLNVHPTAISAIRNGKNWGWLFESETEDSA